MALSAGTRVGPYEIVAPLGRDVAVKVLPPALAGDTQYMARFPPAVPGAPGHASHD